MVAPTHCTSYLPPAKIGISVVTVSALTVLVFGLLSVYYASMQNAVKYTGVVLGGLTVSYFIAHCLLQYRKSKETQTSKKTVSLEIPLPDNTQEKMFVIENTVLAPYREDRKQYVDLSARAMAALFPQGEEEKRVSIGKRVYLAEENPQIFNNTLALNKYQKEEFLEFTGQDISIQPFTVTAVNSASDAPSVTISVSLRDSSLSQDNVCLVKKGFFEKKLEELWLGEVFARSQKMILRFGDLEFVVSLEAKDSISRFFRITKDTQVDFRLNGIYYDEDIPDTTNVTLCFANEAVDVTDHAECELALGAAITRMSSYTAVNGLGKQIFQDSKKHFWCKGQTFEISGKFKGSYRLLFIRKLDQEDQEYDLVRSSGPINVKILSLTQEEKRGLQ